MAEPSLAHLNCTIGYHNVDCGNFVHTGMQLEHSPGVVFTHPRVFVDSTTAIGYSMFTGQGEEALCDTVLHGVYSWVLSVVVWTELTSPRT